MQSENFEELDDIDFLRETDLFSGMSDAIARTIILQSRLVKYPAGAVVVRRGEPGDRLFVVKTGVVEVLRPSPGNKGENTPLAYLGRGECFGELAILTSSPRHADVRVPEHAELLQIEKDLFDDMLANYPGFGGKLCVILAHRLIKMLQDLPTGGTNKELQGDLRYFDLATVIQTLISSNQSGVMTLSSMNRRIGELFFEGGNISHASYDHRSGDEAVHQLFQVQPNAVFHFTSTEKLALREDTGESITVPAMALMLESVRLQDELKPLVEKLPPPTTVLERAETDLEWSEPEGEKEAREIWTRLKGTASVTELLAGSTYCHYHAAQALLLLLEKEQLMPALDSSVP